METLHSLAKELNATLQRDYPLALSLLSERGRRIYFPRTGILSQTTEALGTTFNATIGIALEDDGSPLHHAFLTSASMRHRDRFIRMPRAPASRIPRTLAEGNTSQKPIH